MAAPAIPQAKVSRRSSSLNSHTAPSAALHAVAARPRHVQRRPTKQVSYELANHAKAYIEGGQYASGYDFLSVLLTSGTSISTPAQPYLAFIAPAAYISLASSLIAYPAVTTKSKSLDTVRGADAALRYLRQAQSTIDGPAYPLVRTALTFPRDRSRRRTPGFRSANGSVSPEPSGDVERLAGPAANRESLWCRAEDFWHIVGWAFNCSVTHKKRWDRWKLWLGVMLDFLEADWDVCVKQAKDDQLSVDFVLRGSLIWHYISNNTDPTARVTRRRMTRAILAMATPESLKEYPEVWEKETVVPKQKDEEPQPVGEVDFEKGLVADYDGDEEMQDAPEEEPRPKSASSDNGRMSMRDAVEQLGGTDAIELRQRLIALLANVSTALPDYFTQIDDLFDNILEDFNPLPTTIFHVYLSTFRMPELFQVAFTSNLLRPLIKGTVEDYFNTAPTQNHLEALLPKKAIQQGFSVNAKVSFILERLFLYLMSIGELQSSNALREAMEEGIRARNNVLGAGRGKRGNKEEEKLARELLEASSERLLGILEVLEIASGGKPQPLKKKELKPPQWSFGAESSLSSAPESDTEEEEEE